jgi:SAM-dependent methyltransferase
MGSMFDPLVDEYDAARPSYPAELFDALERLTGRPLAGVDVVEVGAGTGIATRPLLGRGAGVLAVDLGPAMLARLRDRTPASMGRLRGAVVGDANALPVRSGCADLICYAQAWHWVDVPRAVAEVVRVLRPGGHLAVWWNDVFADGQPYWDEQQETLTSWSPGYTLAHRSTDYVAQLRATGAFRSVEESASYWTRELGLDQYDVWLRSKSYVANLGDRKQVFLDQTRRALERAFPDGVVREPFRTRVTVAAVG